MKRVNARRTRGRWSAALLVVAVVVGGCTSTDHTGAPAAPAVVSLTLETRTLGTGSPASFASKLSEASSGRVRVEIKTSSHRELGNRSEDAILADVAAGTVDLGAVSIAALERAGVHSLSPLTTPGLVTTIDSQAAIATSALGTEMLDGVSAANVRGIAILPGPVQVLAAVGAPPTSLDSLRAQPFEVVADSAAARQFVKALGATPVIDDKADTLEPKASVMDLSPTTVSTRRLAGGGTFYANVPLWPEPTILVMNQRAYSDLSTSARGAVDEAGISSAADVAALSAKDDAEALTVLCRSNWRATDADDWLAMHARARADSVSQAMRSDTATGASVEGLVNFMGRQPARQPLNCPADSASSTMPGPFPEELVGTWRAEVTEQALASQPQNPSTFGQVGTWTLELAAGRATFTEPQGGKFEAEVNVAADLITLHIDRGSRNQGLGERWRFHWSVFHDTLTLSLAPDDGFQAGPPALVSQPFNRVG